MESASGKRHWPSVAITAPSRCPDASSTTVEQGDLTLAGGSRRKATIRVTTNQKVGFRVHLDRILGMFLLFICFIHGYADGHRPSA